MINIPKPPTENLYKFAAISGLLLAGSMAYIIGTNAIVVSTRWYESETATAVLGERERQLRWTAVDLGVDWKDLSRHSEAYFDTAEKKDLDRKWNELLRESRQNSGDYYRAQWYLWFCVFSFAGLLVLAAIGVKFSYWGFRHWYHRVQVHEDREIAAKSRASLAEPPPEHQN